MMDLSDLLLDHDRPFIGIYEYSSVAGRLVLAAHSRFYFVLDRHSTKFYNFLPLLSICFLFQERMSLKHRGSSKFMQKQSRFSKYNDEVSLSCHKVQELGLIICVFVLGKTVSAGHAAKEPTTD